MKQLIISEFERIFSRKKTFILFIIFILIVLGDCVFLSFFNVGFYDTENSTTLNNLNLPVLIGKESFFFLGIFILPILFIDSFSSELKSGAYRLMLIRPFNRMQFLFSKWISQFILVSLFLIGELIICYIYGFFVSKTVETTTFLNKNLEFNQLGSIVYTLKYYGILLIVATTILIFSSLVSVLITNPVLNFLMIMGIIIGSLYINEHFSYLLLTGEYAFKLLAGKKMIFYPLNGIIILAGSLLVWLFWNKKDIYN